MQTVELSQKIEQITNRVNNILQQQTSSSYRGITESASVPVTVTKMNKPIAKGRKKQGRRKNDRCEKVM